MNGLAPRAREDSVRPRRLADVVVRPLNFTVRPPRAARMSVDLLVILATSNAPSGEAWSRALSEEHTPVSFTVTVDVKHDSGFIPVQVDGRKSGFEFFIESYADEAALYPVLRDVHFDNPTVYSFSFAGHFDEAAAAFFSASVLVSRFHGVAFDPQSGSFMSAKELTDSGRLCLTLLPR